MKRIKNIKIAEALGISTAAVSMALNNKPGVSEETRKKVFDYINSQQTTPVYPAPSSTFLNKTIVLCIHKQHGAVIIEKSFFSGLIEAIQVETAKEGYPLVISHYNTEIKLQDYIHSLNQSKPYGCIILATEMLQEDMKCYQELSCPYILLDGYFDLYPCDSVTIDNCNAILRAYAYAFKMGHRHIGYLQSDVWISNFEHRFDGFKKAERLFSLEECNHPVFILPANIDGAYQKMSRILDQLPGGFSMPTCFLSDLDYIALGAMQALKEHGYLIPEDISIIGFDNVESCLVCDPPLTTIQLHQKEMGKEAVKLLFQRINHIRNVTIEFRITSELVIRNSVKSLK